MLSEIIPISLMLRVLDTKSVVQHEDGEEDEEGNEEEYDEGEEYDEEQMNGSTAVEVEANKEEGLLTSLAKKHFTLNEVIGRSSDSIEGVPSSDSTNSQLDGISVSNYSRL